MKVAIIGGGSVGLLVASFLAEHQFDITIITRRQSQAQTLSNSGVIKKNVDGSESIFPVSAQTNILNPDQYAFIIVAVKYMQLQEILQKLVSFENLPPLLFLQNGLSHFEEAMQLPFSQIAFGSVSFGAQKENDNMVIHRGIGAINIAVGRGENTAIKQLPLWSSPTLPINLVENAEEMLFHKAFFNCMINPLTFILQLKNGALLTEPHVFTIVKNLFEEMKAAFPEAASITFEQVEALCHRTGENTSSMLSDRLANRQTEIESIVGAMLKKAQQKGKDLPILSTLYQLVLQLEGEGSSK